MATIAAGQRVALLEDERDVLASPPVADLSLWIAVHDGALRAGARNRLTLVVGLDAADENAWVGALDERMLEVVNGNRSGLRRRLADCILKGDRLWSIIRVRGVVTGDPYEPHYTVYSGPRPWVVLGELPNGSLLAVPLNDAATNPKWYTPVLRRHDMRYRGSTKDAQLELAHLWSFDAGLSAIGDVAPAAQEDVLHDVWQYFASG